MSHFVVNQPHKAALNAFCDVTKDEKWRSGGSGTCFGPAGVVQDMNYYRMKIKLFTYGIFSSLYAENSFIMTKSARSVNWGLICHVFSKLEALTRIQQGAA